MLAGKGIVRAGSGKRNCKSWYWKTMGFLMLPHPLTNFELEMYYENEPRFNGFFSRNNLPLKIKDGAYIINLDKYADVGTHCIALFCNRNKNFSLVLVLNMFLKKLKNLSGRKIQQLTFFEYKQTIQQCVGISA